MTPLKRRTFTISFPHDLAAQVEQLAAQESRTTSELFREAFRAYRAQQMRKALRELNELGRSANPQGYMPEDVERLVHEARAATKARRSA
jgi:metal-responsive CopG/Arc/MetJ family transcriptional regulator